VGSTSEATSTEQAPRTASCQGTATGRLCRHGHWGKKGRTLYDDGRTNGAKGRSPRATLEKFRGGARTRSRPLRPARPHGFVVFFYDMVNYADSRPRLRTVREALA